MHPTTIGLDLAKSVFQIHGVDAHGKVVTSKRLRRDAVLTFFANLPPCRVGMEACGTAHYWARELRQLGHEVRLMPPRYVKPYVKRHKNDRADAEAMCEAVTRPNMHFVPIQSEDQQGRAGDPPRPYHAGAAENPADQRLARSLGRVRAGRTAGRTEDRRSDRAAGRAWRRADPGRGQDGAANLGRAAPRYRAPDRGAG